MMKMVAPEVDFTGADMSDALMDRAVLVKANFTNAILNRVVLTSSDLEGAIVENADFTDALLDVKTQQALCKTASGKNPETGVSTLAARDDVDDDELGAGDGANDARGATAATATTTTTLGGTFAGRDVLALDAEGAWRRGRCVRAMDDGTLDVYLTESHTRVAVKASDVRIDIGGQAKTKAKAPPPPPPREVYRGVPEPRRVELTRKTEFVRKEPPKNLEIKPGDDSETRELKRKKLKTFKYKQRQQEISAEQNQKASSWQNFQSKGLKKGKKGIQKNSIFALPEDLTEAKGVGFAGSKPVGNR